MEAILFCIILYYAVKTAHEHTKAAFKSSRKAYADRAAKAHPGMPRRQQVRSALRHDAGFAAAQLRHGFPSARHGFAQGWHEARTAHAEAYAGREKAKAERAESLAGLIEEIRQYRERQAAAAERIRTSAGEGSGEGTPGGSTSPAPGAVIQGTADDVTGTYRMCIHGMSPSCSLCDPEAVVLCGGPGGGGWSKCPECDVYGDEDHKPWCVSRPPLVGPAQQARDADPRLRDACAACGHQGTDDDPLVLASGSRVHRSHTLDPDDGFYGQGPGLGARGNGLASPVPGCWLCGLPVGGGELGKSAHQRCLDVNDRDMKRNEIADDRDLAEVERDLRSRDLCPYQVAYGQGGSPRYCGMPILGDEDGFCPQHEAEAQGDWDGAAEEVHRRTRELLAAEPDPAATTGGTQMSDTTYGSVATDMTSEVATAENRAAEVNAARVAAEAQAQEAAEAKARALRISEDMQALDMDPATLGAIADHIDAADAADKAHQEAEEALGRAHAASVRVMESAQNVQATMAQGHSGLAAAHQEAPVQAAAREFYTE